MQSFGLLILRAFVYLLFVAGVAKLVTIEGFSQLTLSVYDEGSITEQAQNGFVFLSCALFLISALLSAPYRPAALLLSSVTAMLLVRESDAFLDEHLFDGGWQTMVGVVFVGTALILKKYVAEIKPSVLRYSREPSAGVLLSGFLVTIAFSRLFGNGDFWKAVLGDNYVRLVKVIVQEGTELLGYALILIAAVELLIHVLVTRQQNPPTP